MILRGWCGSPNMSATAIRNELLFGTNDNSWDQNKLGHESVGTSHHEPGQFLLWFEVEDTGCGMVLLLFISISLIFFFILLFLFSFSTFTEIFTISLVS